MTTLSRPPLPRPQLTSRRLARLAVLAAVALVLAGSWWWLRSSSLVRIRRVQVVGLSGPDVGAIRTLLTNAALTMTTLNVSDATLARSVAGYRFVAAVHADTEFPHGVVVHVVEHVPIASVRSDGRWTAVDAAGRLLPADATSRLPRLTLAPDVGGDRVTAPGSLATLSILGAAPYAMLPHLERAASSERHGIVVQLRSGPRIDFGDASAPAAKWAAAGAVLADASSAGASYIDVSAPNRPAAGTGNGG